MYYKYNPEISAIDCWDEKPNMWVEVSQQEKNYKGRIYCDKIEYQHARYDTDKTFDLYICIDAKQEGTLRYKHIATLKYIGNTFINFPLPE